MALITSTGVVKLPQALQSPAVQEIFVNAASKRKVSNKTPRRVIRNYVDRRTPSISGICGTSAFPPSGGLWIPGTANERQSTSPNFWQAHELDAPVDGKFNNSPIARPILTQVFSNKPSNSSRIYLYAHCDVHLVIDPANPVAPKFVTHGFSTIDVLNKGAGIWIPTARTRRYTDVTHWSAGDHTLGQSAAVGYAVGEKIDYIEEKKKTDYEI